jgi:hypothetical protein
MDGKWGEAEAQRSCEKLVIWLISEKLREAAAARSLLSPRKQSLSIRASFSGR